MSGPSITTWNRLEPRPRSDSLARALAAQVRDPLWFLTRQWQFGELQGEDAGSPSWVEVRTRFARITGWEASGTESRAYDSATAPIEAAVENEPFYPDDATAVELAQRFESLLARSYAQAFATEPAAMPLEDLVGGFRAAYPLDLPPALLVHPADRDTRRFRRLCSGRAFNGCRLFAATRNVEIPAEPPIADPALRELVRATVALWRAWVRSVLGDIGAADASTWNPERLASEVTVSADMPGGGRARLDAYPGRDGSLEWYALDQRVIEGEAEEPPIQRVHGILPTNLRFPGIPHARWWQMQDRVADFGEIQPELAEPAKLVLMDFMFVQGNDWFVVPFSQDVGSLCRIDRLLVHDVFGGRTLVGRADRPVPGAEDEIRRWSMFATSTSGITGDLADYFVLPPSAAASTLSSEPLESVAFIRDEAANLVWAIEQATENGVGLPWPGRERAEAERREETPVETAAALIYRIQTEVPTHWIPFVPVRTDPLSGQIALALAAMLRPAAEGIGPPQQILPVGRILGPYQHRWLREEEVLRAGVALSRVVRRSRWIDGSTHVWISRARQPGRGEGSSGLDFDTLQPKGFQSFQNK